MYFLLARVIAFLRFFIFFSLFPPVPSSPHADLTADVLFLSDRRATRTFLFFFLLERAVPIRSLSPLLPGPPPSCDPRLDPVAPLSFTFCYPSPSLCSSGDPTLDVFFFSSRTWCARLASPCFFTRL